MKRILVLDFDGVLHSYRSGWKGAAVIPDPPNPGALEFVVRSLETFDVCILSSRSHQWGGRRAMKNWLREHLISEGLKTPCPGWWLNYVAATHSMDPWDVENDYAADRVVKAIRWPLFKPSAHMTIDDRALQFRGEWPSARLLEEFKPWRPT